jgi:hypothetical protein
MTEKKIGRGTNDDLELLLLILAKNPRLRERVMLRVEQLKQRAGETIFDAVKRKNYKTKK